MGGGCDRDSQQPSRGLEGWTCLCLSLDKFLDELDDWFEHQEETQSPSLSGQFQIEMESVEEQKRTFKFNWLMIPLSRAVNQLVIHVDDINSDFAKITKESLHASGDLD